MKMGLLDGLAGQVLGNVLGGGQQGLGGRLLELAVNLVRNAPGGFDGLLQQFRAAGLADAVASWIGTGQNVAIDGDQLTAALGSETVDEVAGQVGVPRQEAASELAVILPRLIDQLTPDGHVPQGDALPGGFAELAAKILRG